MTTTNKTCAACGMPVEDASIVESDPAIICASCADHRDDWPHREAAKWGRRVIGEV